jgi:hypothetical protein
MNLRRAGLVGLLAMLVPLLFSVSPATAKKKHKKPASPPVTVASVTGSTSPGNRQLTVTAACPKGKLAVGGGFDSPFVFSGGEPAAFNFVYESRPASQRSWQVSAVRADNGGTGPSAPTTAYADCRSATLSKKKPAKKASTAKTKKGKLKISEVSGSATTAAATLSQATATAGCPSGTKALGGGFSWSPAPDLSGGGAGGLAILWASYRGNPRNWASSITEASGVARTVTSYAYCAASLKVSETSATVPFPSGGATFNSTSATSPSCPKGLVQLAGGFNSTPPSETTAAAIVTSSKPVGRAWQDSASSINGQPGSLTSYGYCA